MDAKLHEMKLSDGTKVFLATRLTFGEYKGIMNVMLSDVKGQVVQSGQVTQSFDGSVGVRFNEKKVLTIVKKIVNENGEDVPVTQEAINAFPVADGMEVEEYCDKILVEIKKKQSTTRTK